MKSKQVQVGSITTSLNQSDKVLYSFMHAAYFSLKATGREFFMTRETLGENCAMSARTVQRCVKVLEDAGLIEVDRRCKKGSSDQLNYYTVKSHTEAMWDGVVYSDFGSASKPKTTSAKESKKPSILNKFWEDDDGPMF
jgi:DNA-binding transcriptional regulator YhcF (GntR family)